MRSPRVIWQDLSWTTRQWLHTHPAEKSRLIRVGLLALALIAMVSATAVLQRRTDTRKIESMVANARDQLLAAIQNPAAFDGKPSTLLVELERSTQAVETHSADLANAGGFLTEDVANASRRYGDFLANIGRRLLDSGRSQLAADEKTIAYLHAVATMRTSTFHTRAAALRNMEIATRELLHAREKALQECRNLKIALDGHALLQERVRTMLSPDVLLSREQMVPLDFDLKAAIEMRTLARKKLPD